MARSDRMMEKFGGMKKPKNGMKTLGFHQINPFLGRMVI